MNEGKKINILIVLLAAAILLLLFQSFSYNSRLDELASQVSVLRSELANTSSQLYSNLTNYMNTSLRQAQSLVESYSVSYDGVDAAAKTVNLHVSFRLKEASQGAQVKVFALPMGDAAAPGESFEAVTSNGVDYTSDFSIPYSADYNLDIYQTDAAGNSKKLNAETIAKYVKSDFDNRTSMLSGGTGISQERVDVSFELENKTFGQPDFRIKTVELILLADGQEVARRDVTDRSLANAKEIERFNLMVAAGDTNIGDDLPPNPEIGRMQIDPEGVERGYFLEFFPHEQITGEPFDGDSSSNYSFGVEVTYENGEVFTIR